MCGMFDDILTDNKLAKDNFYAPESMKNRQKFKDKVINLDGVITLDDAVIRIDYAKDPKNGYQVKTDEKTGEPIITALVYIAYNGNMYFQTNSRTLVNQIVTIWERENEKSFRVKDPESGKMVFPEMGDYQVKSVAGYKCVIGAEPEKYGTKGTFDIPILKDAE